MGERKRKWNHKLGEKRRGYRMRENEERENEERERGGYKTRKEERGGMIPLRELVLDSLSHLVLLSLSCKGPKPLKWKHT